MEFGGDPMVEGTANKELQKKNKLRNTDLYKQFTFAAMVKLNLTCNG